MLLHGLEEVLPVHPLEVPLVPFLVEVLEVLVPFLVEVPLVPFLVVVPLVPFPVEVPVVLLHRLP